MKNDFVIATVSWIRSPEESKVVLQTIKHLSELNTPIVLTDAGSPSSDVEKMKNMKNIYFFECKKGLTAQLIKSHQEAAKIGQYIFYLHTDKLDFARDTALKMIKKYQGLKNKGVLIPVRSDKSLQTYPEFQRKSENFLNYFLSDYLGIKADYYAGPKIYPSLLVKYLENLTGQIGWGIEAYFYVLAKRLNLPFNFIPFYMRSPNDIDDKEKTKQYRLRIVQWQIEGFFQGQNVNLK